MRKILDGNHNMGGNDLLGGPFLLIAISITFVFHFKINHVTLRTCDVSVSTQH